MIVKWLFFVLFFVAFYYFMESTSNRLCLISFDWWNIFENFFHSDDDLRSKNHYCENGKYSTILQKVDFFLLHFSLSFFNFFQFFLIDNIPLKNIFSASTKSKFNSNSIKSYRSFLSQLQIILKYTLSFKENHVNCRYIPVSGNSPYVFKFLASSGVYFNMTSALLSYVRSQKYH